MVHVLFQSSYLLKISISISVICSIQPQLLNIVKKLSSCRIPLIFYTSGKEKVLLMLLICLLPTLSLIKQTDTVLQNSYENIIKLSSSFNVH